MVKSASRLLSFNLRTHVILPRFMSNMVASRIIAAELLKKRVEKAQNKTSLINVGELQVIGSDCPSFQPSLLVTSGGYSYLFNCNEGFQRLSQANKVKLLNLGNTFITSNNWDSISGTYGLSLTLQDVGSPSFHLRGPEGVGKFFQATRTFINYTSGIETEAFTYHQARDFENDGLKVTMIPINFADIESKNTDNDNRKRLRSETQLIAYACRMPDLPGKLNAQKCKQLNVPIGPMLGRLKNGEDVTLPDGRLIKSSEVCDAKIIGAYFIVLECPDEGNIDAVINNSQLRDLRLSRKSQEQRQIDLVVHMSPEKVTTNEKYREWMNGFSKECRHWMLKHSKHRQLNHLDSYRMMNLLGRLDKEIFPELYVPDNIRDAILTELTGRQEKEDNNFWEIENEMAPPAAVKTDLSNSEQILEAQSLDKFKLRPCGLVESTEQKYVLDGFYRISNLNPLFDELSKRHEELLINMPTPQEHEPELIFLGTGSAIPSKYRNTSCILVNLKVPKNASVILDCGEDSYGQIIRYYGPQKAAEILRQLKMIYVSHHHPDHHIGLIRLIKERRKLTSEPLVVLLPPGVDNLLDFHNENYEDLSDSYIIFSTKKLKSTPNRPTELAGPARSLKSDLLRQLDRLIDDLTIVGVDHCRDACAVVLSLNISRPGMSKFTLAYSGDARPSKDFIEAARGCDLLIHEATFDHRGTEDARLKKHSTTHEAIEVGRRMEAKFTILTHFSARFAKIPYITDEFHDKVGFAFDFLTLRCPTHFGRLPIKNELLKTIFDASMQEVDERHMKRQAQAKILEEHSESSTVGRQANDCEERVKN